MVEAAKAAARFEQRQIDVARAYAQHFERSVSMEPLVQRLTELAAPMTTLGDRDMKEGRAPGR